MQERSRLATAVVVRQGAKSVAREINIPYNQSEMLDRRDNIRPDIRFSWFGDEVLVGLERSALEKMLQFDVARRVGLVEKFELKVWTRWLGWQLPDAVVHARRLINNAVWPPVERAEVIFRMISRHKDVLPVDTFIKVQQKYVVYADLDGLYQYWVAIMMKKGERDYTFPRLPPLEQVKREMLFRYYRNEERVVGHRLTFGNGSAVEDLAIARGVKKYFYPRRYVGVHLLPPKGFYKLVGTRRVEYTESHRIILEWRLDETTFVRSGDWHFFPWLLIAGYSPVTRKVQRVDMHLTPDLVQNLMETMLRTL